MPVVCGSGLLAYIDNIYLCLYNLFVGPHHPHKSREREESKDVESNEIFD